MKFSQAITQVKWLKGGKTLRTRKEMVFEMLVFSPFSHLTSLYSVTRKATDLSSCCYIHEIEMNHSYIVSIKSLSLQPD